MRRLFLSSLLLVGISTSPIQAQTNTTWYITPGNSNADMSWGIDTDTLGNIWWATNEVIAPDSFYDLHISKIGPNGQNLWKKVIYSTPYNDVGFIVKISPPYLFIGGRTESGPSTVTADLLLITCQMQGDTLVQLWDYQWDGNSAYEELDGIEADSTGIYIAGWTSPDTIATHKDMFIQKIDYNGNSIWDTIWPGTPNGFEGANGHMAMDDTALYIAAHYNAYPGRALLISFDKQNGSYLWDTKWDNTPLNPLYYDDFYGVSMSTDSFLYAVGPCDGWGNTGQQAIVKYDRTGNVIWQQTWGGANYEYGRAVITDGDSIIYVAANTNSYGYGSADIALLKYDASGTLLDSAIWGTGRYEPVHDIALFGNSIYLVGKMDTMVHDIGVGSAEENSYLLKVNRADLQFPDTIPTIITDMHYPPIAQKMHVSAYPNPASEHITFEMGHVDNERRLLSIYNPIGKLSRTIYTNSGSVTFHIADLTAGLYFYQVQTTDHKRPVGVKQGKFIVQ